MLASATGTKTVSSHRARSVELRSHEGNAPDDAGAPDVDASRRTRAVRKACPMGTCQGFARKCSDTGVEGLCSSRGRARGVEGAQGQGRSLRQPCAARSPGSGSRQPSIDEGRMRVHCGLCACGRGGSCHAAGRQDQHVHACPSSAGSD
jgi:hypothetical protein